MPGGPRQAGKPASLTMCSGDAPRREVTLDGPDPRAPAQSDPALFLRARAAPAIIDEVQYAPALFAAIKLHVDRHEGDDAFWFTGAQKSHWLRGIGNVPLRKCNSPVADSSRGPHATDVSQCAHGRGATDYLRHECAEPVA